MSMLGEQADELRKMADRLGVNGVCTGDVSKLYVMLREAADTIESLRDRLHELQGVGGKSRYSELFGTPERAARTLERITIVCHTFAICDTCSQEYCIDDDYDALLEWLKGGDEVIGEPDTIRNELTDSGLLRGDA